MPIAAIGREISAAQDPPIKLVWINGVNVVNVRGRPNVEFTLKHSMPHGEVAHTPEEGMQMNLITTALPAINAIPAVCAAPAGIRTYADLPLISGAGFVVS